ncbi:MAG: DUF4255 domain-containing protein [Candidatus Methanogaster sp.]|uniref:DUF4255 domain-containing protein n=1 Tax=Candidatus Methanogaster sp. TaxID=3386292 RepID=A0AC61L0Q3_9EURY|nr:MAG: DUF4255 domain-containing protein [ANME-2 cluster archaeon]
MSNFLAIATVTAALRHTLSAAVGTDVPGAEVTTMRPDEPKKVEPHVNIYLYQVTPNAAWRNADIPTRRNDGGLVQRPQAALDLHYLLTFYGDEEKLEPQRLLGSVVRTLHTMPIITRQVIRDTITNPLFDFLAGSNLADEVELVKLTPTPLSTEELSKLWSVFFQTPYALSIAYQGTVVLIESEDAPQRALPVRERSLYVVPFRQPAIEQVVSQEGADIPIVSGSTLTITGRQLRGDVTQVRVGGVEVTPAPEQLTDTEISLPLPSGLQAGVQGVQVIHQMLMGKPPTPHQGVESNVAAFVLCPTITATVSNVTSYTVIDAAHNEVTLFAADVTVNVSPGVGEKQRVVLLLNEFDPPEDRPAHSYSFKAPQRDEDASLIVIHISDVAPGDYLVRVQVDGAESLLTVDTDQSSSMFNQYIEPKVTIS